MNTTPTLPQMRNRCCDGHSTVLRALLDGRTLQPSRFLSRCWATLRRWGCIDDAGAITDAGRALAGLLNIRPTR